MKLPLHSKRSSAGRNMCANSKTDGCLIRTQLCSAEADHEKVTLRNKCVCTYKGEDVAYRISNSSLSYQVLLFGVYLV